MANPGTVPMRPRLDWRMEYPAGRLRASGNLLANGSLLMPRNGGDSRGSSYARRRRKLELLEIFGDGSKCQCVWCSCELTFETLEQDRRNPNGPYRIANLQPSCRFCNASRGNRERPVTRRAVACAA